MFLLTNIFLIIVNEISSLDVQSGKYSLSASSERHYRYWVGSSSGGYRYTRYFASNGRLNYQGRGGAWVPDTNSVGEWLQVCIMTALHDANFSIEIVG